MIPWKIVILLVFVILLSQGASYGFYHDGNDLKKHCYSDSYYYKGVCLGLISATIEAEESKYYCKQRLSGGMIFYKISAYDACENPKVINIPDRIKLIQAKDVVIKFLDEHPEELHRGAGSLISQALWKAFGLKNDNN